MSTTKCSVPISTLKAAPFSLPWGAPIYVKVTATNVIGSSATSPVGNGAIILTNPDSPLRLVNNPQTTNAYRILVSWEEGLANGGTPVIDYRLLYDQGTNNYITLASGITNLYYLATTLTMGTTYKFKVESRNSYGYSLAPSNEVTIL